jgi:hypothetical protein
VNPLLTSPVREIRTLGSVGAGGGQLPPATQKFRGQTEPPLSRRLRRQEFLKVSDPSVHETSVCPRNLCPRNLSGWGWITRSKMLRWILSTDSAQCNSRASVRSAAFHSQPSTPAGTVRMSTQSGTKMFRDTSLASASFTETTGTGSQRISYCRGIGLTHSFTV